MIIIRMTPGNNQCWKLKFYVSYFILLILAGYKENQLIALEVHLKDYKKVKYSL